QPAAGEQIVEELLRTSWLGRLRRRGGAGFGAGGGFVPVFTTVVGFVRLAHVTSSLFPLACWAFASSRGMPAIIRPRICRSTSLSTTPTIFPRYITAMRSARATTS